MTDETEINLNNKISAYTVETLILKVQTETYYTTVYQIYIYKSCLSGSLISFQLMVTEWNMYINLYYLISFHQYQKTQDNE